MNAFESVAAELNFFLLSVTNHNPSIFANSIFILFYAISFHFSCAFTTAIRSFLIKFLSENNSRDFKRLLSQMFRLGIIITLIYSALIALFSPMISKYSGADEESHRLLMSSLMAGVVYMLVDFISVYINMIMPIIQLEDQLFFLHAFLFMPCMAFISYLLIIVYRFGLLGAMGSFIIASIVMNLVCYRRIQKVMPMFLKVNEATELFI